MARFITIEGGDGSGKSTLIARIERDFTARGIRFLRTREPGGTPVAEEIRQVLLAKRSAPVSALTELLLYEAARAEHVERVIRPALAGGTHVICDRFTTSSIAYQGHARGLGTALVRRLNEIATGGLEPDAVLWLKLSPEESLRRRSGTAEENRLDLEPLDFHRKVHEAFTRLAQEERDRFIELDASRNPDEVFEELTGHPLWRRLWKE